MGEWTNQDGLVIKYGPEKAKMSSVGEVATPATRSYSVMITGQTYDDVSFVIPAGFQLVRAQAEVTEAFALGGTSPTIQLGWSGDADAIAVLSEANAEAVGTYDVDGSMTTTHQTSDRTVTVTLGGTSPTITDAGRAVITYTLSRAV